MDEPHIQAIQISCQLCSHVDIKDSWAHPICKGTIKNSNGPLKFGNLHVFELDMGHWSILRAHHHFGPGLSLDGWEAQWLSGRLLDSRPRGRGFEPHRRHCVVVLEQDTFILAKHWFNPGRPVPD